MLCGLSSASHICDLETYVNVSQFLWQPLLLAISYSHFISWVLSQLQIINHPYFPDADWIDGVYLSHSTITWETGYSDVSTDHHGAPFRTQPRKPFNGN